MNEEDWGDLKNADTGGREPVDPDHWKDSGSRGV